MKKLIQNVLSLLCFLGLQILCSSKTAVTIGVLLNDRTSQVRLPLNSVIYKKNVYDQNVYFTTNISTVSNSDSFEASRTLCDMMDSYIGVAAVFAVDIPDIIPVLESVCTNFEIPFIMTSWRPPVVRNPDQERALLSFYPEAERFAEGLAEIVKSLQWSSFVVVYEDEEGLIRMQDVLKLQEYKRNTRKNNIIVKQLGPGPDYRPLLKEIRNTTEDNMILDCKTENVLPILLQAKSVNMLNLHNRFLITSLNSHTIDFSVLNTTANITILRFHDPKTDNFKNAMHRWQLTEFENRNIQMQLDPKSIKTETLLFHDAILLLTDSISELYFTPGIETSAISCSGNQTTRDGYAIRNYMRIKTPAMTLTGPLEFNKNGDRIHFNIYAVDIMDTVISTYFASNRSIMLARSGKESMDAAVLNLQKIKVIVSSRLGPPYLMPREPTYEGEEFVGNRRYVGYSMDLIDGISKIIGFSYEFVITAKYGNYDPEAKRWNGLIGELLEKRAHLAVCDLTITPERTEVVDFSMPFMTLGISILYKKPDKKDISMFGFLDTFSNAVWIYTATLYLIISIVLFFISRMTPGDWENPHPCEDEPEELENIWDIKNCLWLTLGSIMTQGCDILPKGISSRMAVAMWWFFSLIMTSSYTANLAAFLTKANLEPEIDGAEALSKQTKIKYGVVIGGSTESFFRNSNFSVYQRMWQNMQQFKPSVFEDNNEDGVNRVKTKNSFYAFLMESTQIEYVVETKCTLRQIGNWLDTKSYGIAMPMNSPYRTAINRAVLKLQESGELGILKKKWWKDKRTEQKCDQNPTDEGDSGKLALANVGGVFLVLGVGLSIACVVAVLEFLWNVRNITVEEHVSYWDALKVELIFACKVWITKKRTRPMMSESSSSSGILFDGDAYQSELPLNNTIFSNNIGENNVVTLSTNIRHIPNNDIFDASEIVCDLLNAEEGLVAVFGPSTSTASPLIESIFKNLRVPYILTSWKSTSYDGSETFLNFYPDAEKLSRGIAALIQSLEWNGFVIIYETEEGLVRLQEVLKLQGWNRKTAQDFIRIRQLDKGPDHKPFFKHFKNSTEANFILDCKTENILPILQQVQSLGMLDIHTNIFLTSLDAHTVDYSGLNANANITTIRLFDYKNDDFKNAVFRWTHNELQSYNRRKELSPHSIKTETVLFHDALLYFTDALNDMSEIPENERSSCYNTVSSRDGTELIKVMKNREYLEPLSGPIQFDDNGNRIDFNLHLYNNDQELLAVWSGQNETVALARNYDETSNAAVSNLLKIKVIVSTRLGPPYLMEVVPENEGQILEGNDRYEGYTKDLMDQIAKLIGFTYELYITHKNSYGKWDEDTKRWNGLVGDLLDKRAHLGICDLTITHERQQVVDFSMPFMTLGISILHKYPERSSNNLFTFLEPFATSVWIYSATLYLVVSLVLFFIARMTPGDWENPHPCEEYPSTLENIWGIKNCHWATLGTIMNQGCDILPKGISSRMALAMWWFFALIITNSYIANLTAFLTKDKMELPIKSAEDLAKQSKIKYGLLEGGSTEAFFKTTNNSMYQKMYMNMKSQRPTVFETENVDGVQRVNTTKDGLYAFFMESTQIEYEVEKKCKLKQVGSWLDTKSYGIAMPMNAPYRSAINKAVLQLQEAGYLTTLKKKWWKDVRKGDSCEDLRNQKKDEKEGDLDLAKTTGTFLVLGVGVSIGISIGILEFLWNVRNVSVEEHLSYWEALKAELLFAANIWINRKKIKNSSAESSSERRDYKIDNENTIQNNMMHGADSLMNINSNS